MLRELLISLLSRGISDSSFPNMEVPEAAAGFSWLTAGSAPGTPGPETCTADPHLAFSKENVRVEPGYLVRGNKSVRMSLSLSHFHSRSLVGRSGRAGGRFSRERACFCLEARAFAGRNLVWTSCIFWFQWCVCVSGCLIFSLIAGSVSCHISVCRLWGRDDHTLYFRSVTQATFKEVMLSNNPVVQFLCTVWNVAVINQ